MRDPDADAALPMDAGESSAPTDVGLREVEEIVCEADERGPLAGYRSHNCLTKGLLAFPPAHISQLLF